ncbi:MAG TPA: aromatic ring-hydroxylating dioxygenase subunit alpha, partial [Methylomirabilota bacterium]|nr:aromatic ring-hydroxylating dioxygenase subunit alpha [Methylomirabilota bacterium]
DPARAAATPLPEIAELEGPAPWAYVPIDFVWRAHHSMVIDNLCDLTHAHLHRRFTSFASGRLLDCQSRDDRVLLRYEAKVGPLVHRDVPPSPMTICYEYPYHWASFEWSGIRGRIKYWTFLLPMDARTTRVFFVMSYDALRVRGAPVTLPRPVVRLILRAVQPIVRSLLDQDGVALEAEQAGYEAHWAMPPLELNPAVARLHRLTIRKWEAHLARGAAPRAEVPA